MKTTAVPPAPSSCSPSGRPRTAPGSPSTPYSTLRIASGNDTLRFMLIGDDNLYTDGSLFNNAAQPFSGDFDASFSATTVPEPDTAVLGGPGGLALLRRHRR